MAQPARRRLVIVGAGGFGREVMDIIDALAAVSSDIELLGFLDDGPVDGRLLERRGVRVLGPLALMPKLDALYVIGIGNGSVRRDIDRRLTAEGCAAATLIHPAATIGGDSHIDDGCILTAGCRVTTNVLLGRHVHLNLNSTVGHDSTLSAYCTLHPGATVSGNVNIGEATTIGTGANILPGVTMGPGTTVGGGAVVTRNVDGGVVVGVPARPLPGSAGESN